MRAAFTAAFAETNAFRLMADASVARSCGTTAVVAVVINSMLHIANAGDARGVLCRAPPRDNKLAKPQGLRLSIDHKPGISSERKRIEAGGGSVIRRRGVDRVEGFLAVSRALGDLSLAPHVSCEPYTSSTKILERDEYLILACDGVWDVLTDEVAAAVVFEAVEKGGGVEGAAQALVDRSLQKGSTDNVTVHVIGLKGTEKQPQAEEAEAGGKSEPIVVGNVMHATMAIMETTVAPAPASGSAGGEYLKKKKKKKKRKGKRIGAGAAGQHGDEDVSPGAESSPETSPGFASRTEVESAGELDVTKAMVQPFRPSQRPLEPISQAVELEPEVEPDDAEEESEEEPGTPPGTLPPTASTIDPELFALATALPPTAEDRGGSTSPRSRQARRQAFAAAVQRGDDLVSLDDPAGAVTTYMEALELGTAGERLQVGRSLSNAQLLLCKSLARETVRAKDTHGLRQLIGAVGARAAELVNTAFDEQHGVTLVYFAAQENDHATVSLLLTASVSNDSAMDIMQQRGRRGSLNSGLSFGNQLRLADRPANNGGTPLFVASKLGNLEVVEALISGGCDVDAVVASPGQPIDGLSALLIATRQGHGGVVGLLLEGGANTELSMADGTQPIHVATSHGHASIIRLLAKAGADLNARKDSKKQATPLLSAAQLLNADTVEALVDGGADLSRQVYTPGGDVQTTLRYAHGVAMKASRARPAIGADGSQQQLAAEQAAARRVMEVLQRASRRPVVAAHQRLSLAKLLPRGNSMSEVRQNRALSRVFNRVAARMPLPPCAMTVAWAQQLMVSDPSSAADFRTAVSSGRSRLSSTCTQYPGGPTTTRLSFVTAASGSTSSQAGDPPTVPRDSLYGSPRHETRKWQDVLPNDWSTELVRQWSSSVLGERTASQQSVTEALAGNTGSSSRLVSAGLAASMVDGEALLAVPSFKVLHGVIGRDVPAGPILKLWSGLQQLQLESGVASGEQSAGAMAKKKKWKILENGVEQLVARYVQPPLFLGLSVRRVCYSDALY